MLEQKKFNSSRVAIICLILLGIIVLITSIFTLSSVIAIFGFSLIFWGIILLYIIPTTDNLYMLLNITSEVAFSNFEEFLKIHNIRQNGIYISNAFIISNSLNINTNNQPVIILLNRSLQTSRTYIHQASVNTTDFITLTPPGIGLCKVFEYLSCETFSKISLEKFASIIPFILIKGTKFTEDAQILLDKDTVTIKLSGTSSNMAIQETTDQSRTSLIGCLVSSALACALAKVIGKPIIIESQSLDTQENSLKIVYRILEKI